MIYSLKQDINKTLLNIGFLGAVLLTAVLCFTAPTYHDLTTDRSYSVFESFFSFKREFIESDQQFASINVFQNGLGGHGFPHAGRGGKGFLVGGGLPQGSFGQIIHSGSFRFLGFCFMCMRRRGGTCRDPFPFLSEGVFCRGKREITVATRVKIWYNTMNNCGTQKG